VIAYLDSSVLLRVVLAQPDRLAEWAAIEHAVTSALTEVECLRTLDRRRRQGHLDDEQLAERRGLTFRLLQRCERVDVSPVVLRRASEPFPTPLGTLDAIHVATALLWGRTREALPILATHDLAMATGGRALGFSVVGT